LINLDSKEIDCLKLLFKNKSIKKRDFFLAEGQVCKHECFIINV
jgi:hypothetical protein